MLKLVISPSVLGLWLAALAPTLTACSGSPSPTEEARVTGVVSLPLVASSNGHRYRLNNAEVFIIGPQDAQLSSSGDPSEMMLSTTLQTGNYTALLLSWSLERDDGSGVFVPVQATLASSNAVGFSIFNGTTTTVTYEFDTDGVIVAIGSGGLKVAVAVEETAAVCTPFADDCAAGTWCPPTGLTGAPRACVAAGSIAIGAPCSAPSDCEVNASCFDLGSGPVCAALCPADAIGTPCAGGTCTSAGPDFGICQPVTAE